ncbi:MAG: hypothetical protein ACLQU3_31535, partial [Limisphaerales bacterium]
YLSTNSRLGFDFEHGKARVLVVERDTLNQPGEAFRIRRWRLVRHGGDILKLEQYCGRDSGGWC